jgi:hypothetical protein
MITTYMATWIASLAGSSLPAGLAGIVIGSMPKRRILQPGDPLLRAVSAPVATPSETGGVFQDLRDTLQNSSAITGSDAVSAPSKSGSRSD